MKADVIPVALFAYARIDHLARTLASLRENRVPRLEIFADGAKGSADAGRVTAVRTMLRAIDWCEVRLVERSENLGLGRNILAGVGEVASKYEAFTVWEDDLVCVPGTYDWMCAALRHYSDDSRVMSVTGWTHPRVTPPDVNQPYFDGRAESWSWGAWSRSWCGMNEQTAREKLAAVQKSGMAANYYGADLPIMAREETRKNFWAVRWVYHLLLHHGLCLRPSQSMVEHIGFESTATNAAFATRWANLPLRDMSGIPSKWPEAREHPDCARLWRAANPSPRFGAAERAARWLWHRVRAAFGESGRV